MYMQRYWKPENQLIWQIWPYFLKVSGCISHKVHVLHSSHGKSAPVLWEMSTFHDLHVSKSPNQTHATEDGWWWNERYGAQLSWIGTERTRTCTYHTIYTNVYTNKVCNFIKNKILVAASFPNLHQIGLSYYYQRQKIFWDMSQQFLQEMTLILFVLSILIHEAKCHRWIYYQLVYTA